MCCTDTFAHDHDTVTVYQCMIHKFSKTILVFLLSRLPAAERRGYTSVFNALSRIIRDEGVLTLWRGCGPTIIRAMVVNAAQLASYSQAKQGLFSTGYFEEGILLHFCASMISGLVTTAASMPVDIAKTRIQSMKIIDGKPEYKGAIVSVVRFVGYVPFHSRVRLLGNS